MNKLSNHVSFVPYKHIFIDEFLEKKISQEMIETFPEWDDPLWDKNGKIFKNEYGFKKELTDIDLMPYPYFNFFNYIFHPNFIKEISNIFGIENIMTDTKLYGGGLNLYPPGGKLKIHTDFNYNNDLQAYRAINLLYYINDKWQPENGGCLQLCNQDLIITKEISPKSNSCMIFAPNNKTWHGVSESQSGFYRKSISVWYYTKNTPPNVDVEPHKTRWK